MRRVAGGGGRSAPAQPAARRRAHARQPRASPSRRTSLWDLIHDRAHSHGDLPFDPFMIRQRAPYWMYSLEELRCDLTAFTRGASSSRPRASRSRATSSTRSCFDRLFRFPITGPRVRNYDGLGGQLLFALPAPARLPALDRQPADDRVGARRRRRRRAARATSRSCTAPASTARSSSTGPPRTTSSPPTCRRRPARGGPPASATSPTSRTRGRTSTWCCDDEFPLSIFYTSLKTKLAV